MLHFFLELWRVIAALWKIGNRWLRMAIVSAIVWPLTVILFATIIPSSVGRTMLVSTIALVPFFAITILAMNVPLLWLALAAIPWGRQILAGFFGLIGLELLVGVFFAFIPVSNEPNLVFPFILVALAIILLKMAGWLPKTRKVLGLTLVAMTMVFLLGGWAITKAKLDKSIKAGEGFVSSSLATVNYKYRLCDDALDDTTLVNQRDIAVEIIVHEGCFPGFYHLPKMWDGKRWHIQPVEEKPNRWIAFWFPGEVRPTRAYSCKEMADGIIDLNVSDPTAVRLQGLEGQVFNLHINQPVIPPEPDHPDK